MLYVVMPSLENSEISYRVKCVVVENEKVFGDMVVTKQTRYPSCSTNALYHPNFSRRRLSNLKKEMLEIPDFMALNRKPIRREIGSNPTKEFTILDPRTNSFGKNLSSTAENGKIPDNTDGTLTMEKKQKTYPPPMLRGSSSQEVMVTSLVDQLLLDIYGYPRSEKGRSESDSTASSYKPPPQHRYHRRVRLLRKSKEELTVVLKSLEQHVNHVGGLLVRQLRRRDYLTAKRDKQYDVITAHLQAHSAKRSEDTKMRFSLTPQPGESGFAQWLDAMKMVARLQGGIPQEFRKRLWLTLAERHLDQRGVDWKQAEKLCFNEWSNPDDEELGIQIVKDLHRTGCSLFCGAAGRDNQAVLRRVLLGFARWNKSVGYCQGLNVLAALVLQVTDRAESSAVKVMIYLIEGVLPEGYFADNLRGLSVDMAVFRDLLRMRLPKLSKHLEALQSDAKDKATGSSYEPPLTNVFTMQWFLTLFCHCLPQEAVLRVWDLIFLEGDEVLLRTALAIWEGISDRIMTVKSADEFYSIMGVLTREMLEFTDVNNLIKTIVNMGPLYGVTDLREKHRYNITPWARTLSDEEDTDTEEEERLAVAAAMFGVSQRFKKDRSNASSALQTIGPTNDRERLALDISTLKHQYAKLRERQRQAHIILSAACARQSMVPSSTSQAMNHLLVGKSALVSTKTRQLGPPPGAIPPKPRITATVHNTRVQSGRREKQGVTLHWKDTKKSKDDAKVGDEAETSSGVVSISEGMSSTLTSPQRGSVNDSDSDSTSTELCDEPDRLSDVDSEEPTSTSDCYVMATDDEKSPRPGASPIAGNAVSRQSTDTMTAIKADPAYLDVKSRDKGTKNNRRQSSDAEDTASSIAMITDQIRRLSASDDNHSPPINREKFTRLTNDGAGTEENREIDGSASRNDNFGDTQLSIQTETSPSMITEIEGAARGDPLGSQRNFEMLDRYDFLISTDEPGSTGKLVDPTGSGVEKFREAHTQKVSAASTDDIPSSGGVMGGFETISLTAQIESGQSISISRVNEDIFSYNSEPINLDNQKVGLQLTGPIVPNCSKCEDSSNLMTSPTDDKPGKMAGEQTFYPRSYVIGHLPISPATFNDKLSKATEISPVADDPRILNADSGNTDSSINVNDDPTFGSITKQDPSKTLDSVILLPKKTLLNGGMDTNSRYNVQESTETNATSSINLGSDRRAPDTLTFLATTPKSDVPPDCLDDGVGKDSIASRIVRAKKFSPAFSDSSIDNSRAVTTKMERLHYDFPETDTMATGTFVPTLDERKSLSEDQEVSFRMLAPTLPSAKISQLSSTCVFEDSTAGILFEDRKKSPKSPDSGASVSSGETMGPDSKNSSLVTSPRSLTTRSDSRILPLDKSGRSSFSSDSKTLTLCSQDSEAATNGKVGSEPKSDVTRPSLDQSSPLTPISTDSLKNKSDISPKFVISSSSESCSPEKANKSSEKSFSSELQSPVSANSIKYRTSYVEGQNNLSESPMDLGSATSPFYPIVNPDQKTPSPYGATGKLGTNGNSEETSPEQKSTSSKEFTNFSKYNDNATSLGVTRSSDAGKSSKDKDDYDSGRPFEKELEETLSSLGPGDRKKNGRTTPGRYKEDLDPTSYRHKKTAIEEVEEIEERYMETDTVSPLPRDKYETNRSAFVDKSGVIKGSGLNEPNDRHWLDTRKTLKPFERSCSSLEKRFGRLKASASPDEFTVNPHKKRSSDILQDLKHLEAKTLTDGSTDTSMLTRKTGYVWEDLKKLEARRQDNFSDSASEFSRDRLDPPRINVFSEARTSYVVEPKINLEEGSDSILKSYARKKSNGEPDDDRESKLGVWTKVKPRAGRDNGRRSSDRALKIIQENSAILHKILTCQAKKRLPDLEEISKEITISPINEEISKIFSPILEKMGLNEHEINEELARINFKDFDQMTTASGSEFDAKINDELSKLSLIDDTEVVDPTDIEDVVSNDYLVAREALIDRQINEELSKLLANYEQDSPGCMASNREDVSSLQNPSETEGLDISSISTNVFSYQSSNDSIEIKTELDSIQEAGMSVEKFPQYNEDAISKFGKSSRYSIRGLSPRSDIDIYRELEKLDKISSGEIFPSSSSIVPRTNISPIAYTSQCPVFPDVRPSSLEYSVKLEKKFERSPMKSPYDAYKPYDFKSRISPRKTPSNPYSARSYEKPVMDDSFHFDDDPPSPSRHYELASRPILSKETLEFRVRYDDDGPKVLRTDDLSLEPYQPSLTNFDRGVSYYPNEASMSLKRMEVERNLEEKIVSPLDCGYNQSDFHSRKYEPLSPKNYSYVKNTTDYERAYKIDQDNGEAGSYLPIRPKNSLSMSPNYQYEEREFASSIDDPYLTETSRTFIEASHRPVSRPEFPENLSQLPKYTEVATTSREALNYRKASLTLGPLDPGTSRGSRFQETTPSPRSKFSPFPVRNSSRKPKELGLKLGLYSPSSPSSNPLKRT